MLQRQPGTQTCWGSAAAPSSQALGSPLLIKSPSCGPTASRSHTLRCRADSSGVARDLHNDGAQGMPPSAASLESARRQAECALENFRYQKTNEPPAEEDSAAYLWRKLDAIGRELGGVNEEEFRRLSGGEAHATAPPVLQLSAEAVTLDAGGGGSGGSATSSAPLRQNILPLSPLRPLGGEVIRPEGTGAEVLLQGFNWDSWKNDWYETISRQAPEISAMGFTAVWLPPPTNSVSRQGYMPGDLYNLNSSYGSEQQLLRCIAALQSQGLKVLGDAVLNHRCAQAQDESGVWNRYGGRMAWDSRAIVGDDPNFRGRGNRSSGDIFAAAPNIDHSQDFVKRDISEWLVWLRTHAGFDGWRLDFVKGFHGSHVKDYLEASVPQFCVGEFWDTMAYDWDGTPAHNQDGHRQRTVDWINAAGGLSTAFDITSKGIMHAVFERTEYWRLRDEKGKPPGLLGWWPSRAVTFLENHDTGSSQGHWRFPSHSLEQGYAYLLTHPGTPTVFYDHAFHDRHLAPVVARLIAIRTRMGIHCRSAVKILAAEHNVYAAEIDEKIVMKIGPGNYSPSSLYSIVDCGQHWAVWERKP